MEMLRMDNVRIVFRNFSGREAKYNREGDRNFALVIDDEIEARKLIDDGWNVKIKPPKEDGDKPFCYLTVKVKYNRRDDGRKTGPIVYLRSGSHMNKLDEESISVLDDIDIENVDLDVRPYEWEVNGKTGISAYLASICVTQRLDRFAERYEREDNE